MIKKILISIFAGLLFISLVVATVFVLLDDGVEIPEEYIEAWDVSATNDKSVMAYVTADSKNQGGYLLTVAGTGDMLNYDLNQNRTQWHKTKDKNDASYEENITRILVGKKVNSIGDCAFANLKKLQSIKFNSQTKSIGSYAFMYCISLSNIVMNNEIELIGKGAFMSCNSLTVLKLPHSLIRISDRLFTGCKSLQKLYIPQSVATVGMNAFESTGLSKIDSSVYYQGTKAEWASVSISGGNDVLKTVALTYNWNY